MMGVVWDSIRRVFLRGTDNVLRTGAYPPAWAWSPYEQAQPFGRVIWRNVTELLTSLAQDVTLTYTGDKTLLFQQFRRFFEADGETVLCRYFDDGAVVVGRDEYGFRILRPDEYAVSGRGREQVVTGKPGVDVYVMRSTAFDVTGLSDKALCAPYLEYLDNALNASNTCSARLGALIVGTPAQSNGLPTPVVLTEAQKNDLEKSIGAEYGALRGQKQFMLLPRAMNFQSVSLAGVDARVNEKVRLAVLAICDRVKVPANQVAIIDANSGKTLANGSELREGDYNKYQSFERLLSRTFLRMGAASGLRGLSYTIYNKPARGASI